MCVYIYIYIYILVAPKSSNGNPITSTNNIVVDLKSEQDLDRTLVDRNRFPEFRNEYVEPQENSSLNTSTEVQFRVMTTYV